MKDDMRDLELLKLAAKAADVKINQWHTDDFGVIAWSESEGKHWNPLEDAGDAFRLALKLGIRFYDDKQEKVAVAFWSDVQSVHQQYAREDRAEKAAMRAIVRAAVIMQQDKEDKEKYEV